MTGFRPPIVAGVSGGVGTTTLALALHGTDAGTTTADADILVCRSTAESIDRATRIADLAEPGRYPVLVVTLAGAERRPPPRVAELEEVWAAVVAAPHVGRWSGIVDPYREAAGLLGNPREQLPRPVRRYLDAVARAARVVAESGRLNAPAPRTEVPRANPVLPPVVPLDLPAPRGWSGRTALHQPIPLPPHRTATVDRTLQHHPQSLATSDVLGPLTHPAPEHRHPPTSADLGPFASPLPAHPSASTSARPGRTTSGDWRPSVSSTTGDHEACAEPAPEHRRPTAEGPDHRPAAPHPGADDRAAAAVRADPPGWSDARIPVREDVPPAAAAGSRVGGPETVAEPSAETSTELSTVDFTGCGGAPTLELPELRPVRGIRVLAIGTVSG